MANSSWDSYQKDLANQGMDLTVDQKTGAVTVDLKANATGAFNAASVKSPITIKATSNVSGVSLTTGSGNDKFTFEKKVDGVTINMGTGNNTLTVTEDLNNSNIEVSGNGENLIAVGGKIDPTYLRLADGKDSVIAGGIEDSTVYGGAGADIVSVGGGLDGVVNSVIDLGEGTDSIIVEGALTNSTLNAGNDNDFVEIFAGTDALVDLGSGRDSIVIGSTASTTSKFDGISVVGGAGKDTFNVVADASGVTITDFNVDEDALVFTAAATINNLDYNSAGVIGVGNDSISIASTNGYYAVNVEGRQILAWTSDEGAVVDGSSKTKALILDGTKNDNVSDTLMGGSKADSIAAGEGDVAYGGAGRDYIYLAKETKDNKQETVAINTAGGKDTVYGFQVKGDSKATADEADVVYLFDESIESLRLSKGDSTNNLVVKDGDASLELIGVKTSSDVELNVMDNSGSITKVDYVVGKATITDADEMANVYYSANKTAELDFSGVGSALVVDLDRTGMAGLTNTNDALYYGKFASVTGGQDDTVLMGSAANKETLIAGSGNTTMWGGGSKGDVLTHSSGSNTAVFFFNAGDGKDTVTSGNWGTEDESDILWLGGEAAISKVKGTSTGAAITLSDVSDKLTITGLGSDEVIKFSTDGQTVKKAKVGSGSNTNWTYADDVSTYVGGGSKNTLTFKSSDDNAQVWLDNAHGVTYENVKVVDASANTGSVILAGSAANETLIAGKGDSSVWGGTGNDTLVGNSTGTTEFYFGKGAGKDVITKSSADDKVMLFDVALGDVAGANYSSGTMKISLTDGSTLTVQNMSASSVNTFQLNDGSKWTFNTSTKTWSQA